MNPFPTDAHLLIYGQLTATGSIDLFNAHGPHDVYGEITVEHGGAGSILGIGDLPSGASITLGTEPGDVFSGDMIVRGGGWFWGVAGAINMMNVGAGADIVICGLTEQGELTIGGDVSESASVAITSCDDMAGTIDIAGDLMGEITIDKSLALSGEISAQSVGGLIAIDNKLDDAETGEWLGDITIDGYTLTPGVYCNDPAIGGGSIVVTPVDCNENGVPDVCDAPDGDSDGDVDLADFAALQVCFTEDPSQACLDYFDRAWDCGEIDLDDYVVFASHMTGPDPGRGGDGGGGEGGRPMGAPVPDPWTHVEADVFVILEAMDGDSDRDVTTLEPNTTYLVRYQADYDRVDSYGLFAVSTSAGHGFVAAEAAPGGAWSHTGNFMFMDIDEQFGHPVTAPGYPENHFRYALAGDEIWSPDDEDAPDYTGPVGRLCTITTEGEGELNLHLYMWYTNEEEYLNVRMETQATYPVVASQ